MGVHDHSKDENDPTLRPPWGGLPPQFQYPAECRARIFFQGRHVFTVTIDNEAPCATALQARVQRALESSAPVARLILWATVPGTEDGRLVINSDKALRQIVTTATTTCNVFLAVSFASTTTPSKGKQVLRTIQLLQEAQRTPHLRGQIKLLNRALLPAPTRMSKSGPRRAATRTPVYERRRKRFVAMLMRMRREPEKAAQWLERMSIAHSREPQMARILSLLTIFVAQLR